MYYIAVLAKFETYVESDLLDVKIRTWDRIDWVIEG